MTATPDVIAAAISQVEQGFAAFALRANAKVPITEHGFKNATTKPDWIATQLQAAPAGNYGIVWPTDAPPVVVFDLDDGGGADRPWQDRLLDLIGLHGPLPSTKSTRTPSGGRHAFYRWPQSVPIPPGDELFGFTVRWPGRGYLVGPGSSIDGVPYVAGDNLAIAELPPAWVYAAIAEHPPATTRQPGNGLITITGGFTLPDEIPSGRRYAAVRDYVASRYNDNLSRDELWALVQSQVAPRFEQPKTEDELRADFDRVTSKIVERLGPPVRREPPAPRTPQQIAASSIDAAELLAMDIPALEWIVPGLVPEGTTVLAGPPKLGKSCLVYQMAVEVSIGGELLGRAIAPGSVLYLALEDGKRRGQTRLRAALVDRVMPKGQLTVRWSSARIGEGLEEEILAWLDEHPDARLVAIDTLQRVRARADARRNAYEVDVEDLGRLQNLFRDRRVALVIVHHSKKETGDDFLASVSGTYGITGSADTTVVIQRKRLEAFGKIVVTGRDVEEVEVPVQFNGLTWTLAPMSIAEATMERAEVYKVIEAEGPIFPAAIAQILGSTREAVSKLVSRMVSSGSIARTTGGYVVAGFELVIGGAGRPVPIDSGTEGQPEAHTGEIGPSSPSDPTRTGARVGVPSPSRPSSPSEDDSEGPAGRGIHASRVGETAPRLTVVPDEAPATPTAAWCRFFAEHQFRHRDVQTDSPWCEICTPREEPA